MNKKIFFRLFILTAAGLLNYTMVSGQTVPKNVPNGADQTLQISRKKIDSLDQALIQLLGERERVVRAIGVYKAQNNIPSLQADRFKQVLEKSVEAGKKQDLSAAFITEVMNAIHKESLRIEDDLKAQK